MSEQALNDARLGQAQQQVSSLQTMTRSMSGQIAAQKECITNYVQANVTLRASNLLLEDDVIQSKNKILALEERIHGLEAEKVLLQEEIAKSKPSTPVLDEQNNAA